MKAISINAYEIENDDGETMVFMTPKEFDFIKKQNELKDNEIERLNNIIKEVRELRKHLSNKYYELGEEVDIGVIIEHIDRILDKENK